MQRNTLWVIGIIVVIVAGGIIFALNRGEDEGEQVDKGISAVFTCDAGKNISATFYQGAAIASSTPGAPPTPGGSVHLALSDGRTVDLPQTISADGARYASADGSVIFWN